MPRTPNRDRAPARNARAFVVAGAIALGALAVYQGVAIVLAGEPAITVSLPGDGALVRTVAEPDLDAAHGRAPTDVTVEITGRSRLRPLPPAPRCVVLAGDAEVEATDVDWLAGTASVPAQEVREGDAQLVRVRLHGQETLRLARVRHGAVRIHLGGPILVGGTVVDTAGKAVAGARVWAAGREVETDADGTFAIEAAAGDCLPVAVAARGMASQAVVLEAWQNTDLRLVLQPAGEVRVRLAGVVPGDGAARVLVLPAGEPRSSAEAQYPFFLQALTGGSPADRQSMVRLDDLPLGARLQVRLLHDRTTAEEVVLPEARARAAEVSLVAHAAASVSGKVLDERGAAVPGACVLAWPERDGDDLPRRAGASLALPPAAYVGRGAATRSGADGGFRAARTPGAPTRVLAAGPGLAAEAVLAGAGDLVHDLIVPRNAAGSGAGAQLELRAASGGPFRVRVIERGGGPRPAVLWTGTEPFPIALRSAACADVKITVGAAPDHLVRTLPALAIVGPVPVDLPEASR